MDNQDIPSSFQAYLKVWYSWLVSQKQSLSYYQRMLGDIYYWRAADKALLISSVAFVVNTIVLVIGLVLLMSNPEGLSMDIENVRWAVILMLGNLLMLISSIILSSVFGKKESLQNFLLVYALFCLVISLATLTGTLGFFDSITWQLFFLFNASLIVFLDRVWVVSSFLMLLVFMIVMTFSESSLPFPVRAIRLIPNMRLEDIGFYGLLFQWVQLLWAGALGIVIVDFFLSSWRSREVDLRSKSYIDELTGLINRRAVLEGLSEEYRRAQRADYPISVAIIDLDHFKKVNDSFGHPFGDVVLQGVAEEMRSIGRKNDLVGRYGGEEFLIVFPECSAKVATVILERLRERVSKRVFETEVGEPVSVTISAGVAQQEETDEEYLQVIARADFALYRAKEFGRDQVLSVEIEDNEQLAFLDRI